MTLASRSQVTQVRPAGKAFIRRSIRAVSGPPVAAWRFNPTLSGQADELLDVSANMAGTFVGSAPNNADGGWMHGPSNLHCLSLNGTSNLIDFYSARLEAVFLDSLWSLSLWAKVRNETIWEDSTLRTIIYMAADGNNIIKIEKETTDNKINFSYKAGGTTDAVSHSMLVDNESPVTWVNYGLSMDAGNNELKAYVKGVQAGSTQASLGTWSGAFNSDTVCIGSTATGTPASLFDGGISDLIIWNQILTADEFRLLANVR